MVECSSFVSIFNLTEVPFLIETTQLLSNNFLLSLHGEKLDKNMTCVILGLLGKDNTVQGETSTDVMFDDVLVYGGWMFCPKRCN